MAATFQRRPAGSSTSTGARMADVSPYVAFVANAVFLLGFHAHADASEATAPETLLDRLSQGPDALNTLDKLLFGVLILLAFELLDFITSHSGKWINAKQIPVRGKHLDTFGATDKIFVGLSKAATAPFIYFYLRFAYFEPGVNWNVQQLSTANTVLALVALFVVYDFFYTILHWFLHIKGIYGFIHKHHHHQKAPSRANVDAVNVHPVEFFLGEYNHLWTLYLCSRFMEIHVITSMVFLAVGGVLAGLNHTRYDLVWSVWNCQIFDSKAHDVHHRIPQCNYGQYSMIWDVVFGTYRAYNPKDRINAAAQLDPLTGKSMEYMKRQTKSQ